MVLLRVEEVLQIRLQGAELSDIREYAKEKEWNLSDTQLWRYMQKADALMAAQIEKDRDKIFARHVLQRRALYAHSVTGGDYRAALSVLKDEAELLDLYPAKKVKEEHTGLVKLEIVEEIIDTADTAKYGPGRAEDGPQDGSAAPGTG